MTDATEQRPGVYAAAWCAVAFGSGAAALLFETLWFRVAGLTLGNGVWAGSIVLAAFMAGLALGNALAARRADHVARPARLYGLLEATIGLSGFLLVVGLPAATPVLAPVLQALRDTPAAVNGLRAVVAFVAMMVPATAMGATLPVLVKSLSRHDARFGRVLGRLYGWNTLGAVVGSLLGESLLLEALGMRGTAGAALALNLLSATGALLLARRVGERRPEAPAAPRAPVGSARP
ncbi:MAG TPA: spermidine synthase, partial [Myxococcota bacterium]|nr:spermidine synthase [Myxococcota bacterium]